MLPQPTLTRSTVVTLTHPTVTLSWFMPDEVRSRAGRGATAERKHHVLAGISRCEDKPFVLQTSRTEKTDASRGCFSGLECLCGAYARSFVSHTNLRQNDGSPPAGVTVPGAPNE